MVIHGAVKDITVEVVRRNPDDQGKGFVPQSKRWVVEQVNGTLMLQRRLARVRPPVRQRGLPRLLSLHRRHAPPPHHPRRYLAGRRGAGRVNVYELLRLLQTEHDETAARGQRARTGMGYEQWPCTSASGGGARSVSCPMSRLIEPPV